MNKNILVSVGILFFFSLAAACQNPVDTPGDAESQQDNQTQQPGTQDAYDLSGSWQSLDTQDKFTSSNISPAATLDPPDGPLYDSEFIPDDPLFTEQWNLSELDMPAVWAWIENRQIDLSTVTVAILDTGVDETSSDFASGTFVTGYNAVDDNTDTSDQVGHGTHVAGTIAQATNNGAGAAGMADGVRLMPIKVINRSVTSTPQLIAEGIAEAVSRGADVINMSIGDPNATTPDQAMLDVQTAIQDAVSQGVVVLAATGNAGETNTRYPAAFPETIAVGAITSYQSLADYSNYGPNDEVDVVAPGGNVPQGVIGSPPNQDIIWNTTSTGSIDAILQQTPSTLGSYTLAEEYQSTGFWHVFGTSQAAPHVTALAALLKAADPTLTVQEIRDAIESTAIDLGPAGRDDEYGYCLINPVGALTRGIHDYSDIVAQATSPIAPGAFSDVWEIEADAGGIDVTLSVSDDSREFSLLLYNSDGKLLARQSAIGGQVQLQYDDVKLLGGTHYIVVGAE